MCTWLIFLLVFCLTRIGTTISFHRQKRDHFNNRQSSNDIAPTTLANNRLIWKKDELQTNANNVLIEEYADLEDKNQVNYRVTRRARRNNGEATTHPVDREREIKYKTQQDIKMRLIKKRHHSNDNEIINKNNSNRKYLKPKSSLRKEQHKSKEEHLGEMDRIILAMTLRHFVKDDPSPLTALPNLGHNKRHRPEVNKNSRKKQVKKKKMSRHESLDNLNRMVQLFQNAMRKILKSIENEYNFSDTDIIDKKNGTKSDNTDSDKMIKVRAEEDGNIFNTHSHKGTRNRRSVMSSKETPTKEQKTSNSSQSMDSKMLSKNDFIFLRKKLEKLAKILSISSGHYKSNKTKIKRGNPGDSSALLNSGVQKDASRADQDDAKQKHKPVIQTQDQRQNDNFSQIHSATKNGRKNRTCCIKQLESKDLVEKSNFGKSQNKSSYPTQIIHDDDKLSCDKIEQFLVMLRDFQKFSKEDKNEKDFNILSTDVLKAIFLHTIGIMDENLMTTYKDRLLECLNIRKKVRENRKNPAILTNTNSNLDQPMNGMQVVEKEHKNPKQMTESKNKNIISQEPSNFTTLQNILGRNYHRQETKDFFREKFEIQNPFSSQGKLKIRVPCRQNERRFRPYLFSYYGNIDQDKSRFPPAVGRINPLVLKYPPSANDKGDEMWGRFSQFAEDSDEEPRGPVPTDNAPAMALYNDAPRPRINIDDSEGPLRGAFGRGKLIQKDVLWSQPDRYLPATFESGKEQDITSPFSKVMEEEQQNTFYPSPGMLDRISHNIMVNKLRQDKQTDQAVTDLMPKDGAISQERNRMENDPRVYLQSLRNLPASYFRKPMDTRERSLSNQMRLRGSGKQLTPNQFGMAQANNMLYPQALAPLHGAIYQPTIRLLFSWQIQEGENNIKSTIQYDTTTFAYYKSE